ncbi:MAG: hypothetical protein ACJAX5_002792 [Patiriisocius sp.]
MDRLDEDRKKLNKKQECTLAVRITAANKLIFVDRNDIKTEVLSAASASQPSVVMCNSLGFSANGIQVVVDEDIALGSILRLCIDMPEQKPIFLVGEVMWQRADTGGICLGFLVYESDDSDIADWKQSIANRLNRQH